MKGRGEEKNKLQSLGGRDPPNVLEKDKGCEGRGSKPGLEKEQWKVKRSPEVLTSGGYEGKKNYTRR